MYLQYFEKMQSFIDSLAWSFAIWSSVATCCRIILAVFYNETDKMTDYLQGKKRTFGISESLTIAVICWLWILT